MELIYGVKDKPKFWQNLLFAFQQFLAIIAATILVPILADNTGVYLSQSAALIGAGFGTIVYLLFTKFESPVFLGSSFAFISPLAAAVSFGYFGIILGAIFAGLVYVVIALIVKFVGAKWISKLMPPVIIGPTVALIGLNLSGSAVNNILSAGSVAGNLITALVALVAFFIVVIVSIKGSKALKMFPFVVGVLGAYILALVFTLIGRAANVEWLQIVNFEPFTKIGDINNWLPNITFLGLFKEGASKITGFGDIVSIFVAFAPVALVVFAEHVADHKNISSIINQDLLEKPGLHRTLLGDGVGSIVGSIFGGCPNTTYGESIGCVAITGNASTTTILTTAILSIVIAFFYPAMAFVASIPSCIVGGICIALYGFIAVSGLRMFKHVDLDNSKNLFIVAAILVCGIGGLALNFGKVEISNIATALILGIVLNLILKPDDSKVDKKVEPTQNKVAVQDLFGATYEEKKDEE